MISDHTSNVESQDAKYNFSKYRKITKGPLLQSILCLSYKSFTRTSSSIDVVSLMLINALLTDSNNALLRKSICEKQSLAYNVISFPRFLGEDIGLFQIIVQTSKWNTNKVISAMENLLKNIDKTDVERVLPSLKKRVISELIISFEDIDSRNILLGEIELLHQGFFKNIIRDLKKVDAMVVLKNIKKIFDCDPQITILG